MSIKRITVGQGIDLNIIESDKFKTNFISFNFVSPLTRENAAKNALLFRVLHRGSKKYPKVATLNERLDYLYATTVGMRNYKRGEAQIIGLAAEMLGNEYTDDGFDLTGAVCDFLYEVIFNPLAENGSFSENYTEQEKENLIADVMAKINDKRRYAPFRCYEEMCRGEAYGISELGSVEDIESIDPTALYKHYLSVIKHSKIEIFFIGRCDADSLAKKLTDMLATLERGDCEKIATEVVRSVKEVKYVEDKLPVTQGKLSLGFRTGICVNDPDYAALVMFNEIYGGSVASKLFMNVRERLSLCYYCSSSFESYKGTMMVNSGIEFDKREVAEKEILDQLDAIRKGDISDYEYSSAKRSLKNAYMHMLDSPTSMEMYYLGRMMVGVYESIEESAARFENITRDEIVSAANKVKLDTVYFMAGREGDDCE